MLDNARAIDRIERAQSAQPTCACGRHTHPVWRDGVVWLECSSLTEPAAGRLTRVIDAFLMPTHTHVRILDDSEVGMAA